MYVDKKQLAPHCNRHTTQGKIALCIGSQHPEGLFRQQCLQQLLKEKEQNPKMNNKEFNKKHFQKFENAESFDSKK